MEQTLRDIHLKLDNIDKKIDHLNIQISKNSEDCQKMTSHITFIEKVYDNVKNPMMYVVNKINTLSKNEPGSLK
jgi:archaellum component FlaC